MNGEGFRDQGSGFRAYVQYAALEIILLVEGEQKGVLKNPLSTCNPKHMGGTRELFYFVVSSCKATTTATGNEDFLMLVIRVDIADLRLP